MAWLPCTRSQAMEFSDAELVELRSRCLMASQRGYIIARADEYMAALGAEGASAAQLFEAADLELKVRASGGKKPKIEKKKAEAPKTVEKPAKVEEKKPEAPKVIEVKAEPPKVVEPVVKPYEEWTYDELYAEVQARDIPGRSTLKNKEALALALYEHDEAAAKK